MADDSLLREAYAARAGGPPAHVADGDWERLACGELTGEERDRALDHASRCADCGAVLRGLLLLEREAGAIDTGVPAGLSARGAGGPSARGRWAWGLAAAAAAAVVAVIGVLARPTVVPPTSVEEAELRSADENDRPVPVRPRDELAAPPDGFSWEGVTGARSYRVELLDAAGEAVWRSEDVAATTLAWPDSVPAAPGRYYWRVVATLESRGEALASPLVSFEILASPER